MENVEILEQYNRLVAWLERAGNPFSRKPEQQAMLVNLERAGPDAIVAEVLAGRLNLEEQEIQAFGAPISRLFGRGFAPGGYFMRCTGCQGQKIADKRAWTCHECALEGCTQ